MLAFVNISVIGLVAMPECGYGRFVDANRAYEDKHGFIYIVYLAATVDLSRRVDWSVWRTLGVMLAGTVPFLSFVAERFATRDVRGRIARVEAGVSVSSGDAPTMGDPT